MQVSFCKELKAQGLVKYYKKKKAIENISLFIKEKKIVGLLGPNGAGKSTTFYIISGFIKPNQGDVFLNKIKITSLAPFKRARLGIAYLPQEPSIFLGLTVKENLQAVEEVLGIKKDEKERIIKEFELGEYLQKRGWELSGGIRRRVEIARCLLTKPDFLLLDEPFTGLDPITTENLQEILLKLKTKGIGILITDHRVFETLEIIDQVYIIYQGQIIFQGEAKDILNDLEVKKLYFGDRMYENLKLIKNK